MKMSVATVGTGFPVSSVDPSFTQSRSALMTKIGINGYHTATIIQTYL